MSRRSPLKRKRTSQSRKKYSGYSGGNRRPGEKPKNFKETVSRFVPLLKPFIPGMVVVLIAGVIGTVLTVTGPMFLGDIVDAIKEQADIKLSGGADKEDRKSTRLNSSHNRESRMPSSA